MKICGEQYLKMEKLSLYLVSKKIVAVPFFGMHGGSAGDGCGGDGDDDHDYWKRAQRCLPPKSHRISSPLVLTA